jgi:hypothetical protein
VSPGGPQEAEADRLWIRQPKPEALAAVKTRLGIPVTD